MKILVYSWYNLFVGMTDNKRKVKMTKQMTMLELNEVLTDSSIAMQCWRKLRDDCMAVDAPLDLMYELKLGFEWHKACISACPTVITACQMVQGLDMLLEKYLDKCPHDKHDALKALSQEAWDYLDQNSGDENIR